MLLQRGNQLFSQLNTIEAMAKDVRIVESINAIFNANEFPFVLLYDPKSTKLKSFWDHVQ
jgi:hypothetical protein